jgi:DNA-binding NtrC family response regulator
MERLLAHDWPGNVRELVHVIERASVLSGGEIIDVGHLPDALGASGGSSVAETGSDGQTLHEAVRQLEKSMIQRALDRAKGNRSEAARQLGIGRPQLYAKMEEHGLGGKPDGGN